MPDAARSVTSGAAILLHRLSQAEARMTRILGISITLVFLAATWTTAQRGMGMGMGGMHPIQPIEPARITNQAMVDLGAKLFFDPRLSKSANARFDRWLKGDRTALTADEFEGHRLFMHSGCMACHNGPAAGGTSFKKMGHARRRGTVTAGTARWHRR
jgi:cytochrome c peroxidase